VNRPFGYGPALVGWRPTKLRSILTRTRRFGRPDLPLLSVNLPSGVVLRPEDSGRPAASEDLSGYQHVKPGDLVVNQLGKPHGALGVSWHEGIISPAYFVASIKPVAEPRFIHHLLRTRLYISEYERRGKFMPPNQFDISWDQFRDIELTLPPLALQRAIADYLDTETARIDALIAKKLQMIELLVARRLSAIEESLGGGRSAATYLVGSGAALHRAVPMKRLLSATIAGGTPDSNDIDFWTDDPQGVAWVAIGDMVDCSATTDTARRLTPTGLAASRLRIAPAGTLLFAMYASLGKLTVTAMPCVWNQAILGLVPDQAKVDAEYLALWLEALRPHLGVIARSTTQDNLNAEQVGALPVPLWSLEEQRRLVETLRPVLVSLSAVAERIARQVGLLREHRQALITAAVTGELEVSGVAA